MEFHLDCAANEPIVYKQHFSAFSVPMLKEHLGDSRRLVVAGVSVDCCVLKTVFDASELGFECLVGMQAVSATKLEDYLSAIRILSKSACSVIDLDLLETADLKGTCINDLEVESRARSWYLSVAGSGPESMPKLD